jgi:hypothetical protein
MFGRAATVVGALAALELQAVGADVGASADEDDPSLSVEVHGFVSQGAIKTTANNYLARSERGSLEFSEVGINFTSTPTEKLRLGLQLFARDLGPIGDYIPHADWFYLDYRWKDWLGLRAGRVKLPFGLYNDISDIDAARVSILLPQSVYPVANRDFLLAQTGIEVYGYLNLRVAGALEYRLYGGSIFFPFQNSPASPFQIVTLENPYVVGGRVLWEAPLEGLRVGGSVQALRLDAVLLNPMTAAPVNVEIPALLWVASAEYLGHSLFAAAEYSQWHVDTQSTDPAVIPASYAVSQRAYGMLAYYLKHWFQPGVYYSVVYPHIEARTGPTNMQHDVAATLRFDVNPYWLFKLEGHYMHGVAGLQPALNNNTPPAMLVRDWGVFLVKTTAYF